MTLVRNSQVWYRLRAGARLLGWDDLAGEVQHLPSKAEAVLGPDDVVLFYPPGGGGYGDPLERDPEQVARDVVEGHVSGERAAQNYGVVLGPRGEVDRAATEELRARLRAERSQGQRVPFGPEDLPLPPRGEPQPRPLTEVLELVLTPAGPTLRCRRCGHSGTYHRRLLPLAAAGPWIAVAWAGCSPHFVLEERSCPGCGVLFAVREIRLPAP